MTQEGIPYCYMVGFFVLFDPLAPAPPHVNNDRRGKVKCGDCLGCKHSRLQVEGEGFAFTYTGISTSFPMTGVFVPGQSSMTGGETPYEKFLKQLNKDLQEKFKINVFRINTYYYNETILSGKGQGDLYGIGSMKMVLLDKEGEWLH